MCTGALQSTCSLRSVSLHSSHLCALLQYIPASEMLSSTVSPAVMSAAASPPARAFSLASCANENFHFLIHPGQLD